MRQPLWTALLSSTISISALAIMVTAPSWADVPIAGYADLVEKVTPSVVFIEVTSKSTEPMAADGGQQFGHPSPFDEFLKRFGQGNPQFSQPNTPRGDDVMHGLGSGFLISADGEIVTNNHVVDGATIIKVKLDDGREFGAHVIGTDPLTDVALIKLDKASGLPFASFGASEKLRVGDAVVAIGNPFGLGGTVTSGIVSAMGRNINSGPYDSFIQTDAAINKGNSGGPLFDTVGQVVGMNTAIFSPSGGSVGIGFSVPAQTIQNVVAQLQDHGSVNRGWLGVQIQPVTEDLAQALGLTKPQGALVADVLPDSPALAAHLQGGDVILAVNGSVVDEKHGLPVIIADIAAGKTADLSILRGGKAQIVKVTIGALSPEKLQLASATGSDAAAMNAQLGISVEPLVPDFAAKLGLSPDAKGLFISEVAPDGPNANRLKAGDIVEEIAGQQVTTSAALTAALSGVKGKSSVLLKITRDGQPMFVGAALATS
jgi:serine protease Do